MGTHGYAAPEYVTTGRIKTFPYGLSKNWSLLSRRYFELTFIYDTGHLYVKSDVYGFGVVLIEILTGLRALDENRPTGQENLVDWIKPYLSERRKLKNVMDFRLEGKYPSRSAFQVAQLALQCIEKEQKNRPPMKDVVETLEQIETNEKPIEPRPRASRLASNRNAHQPLHHNSPIHVKQYGGIHAYQTTPPRLR